MCHSFPGGRPLCCRRRCRRRSFEGESDARSSVSLRGRGRSSRPADPPADLPLGNVSYRCDGGSQVQATYGSGTVAIRWNGRVHDLTADPTSTDRTLFKSASYQWRLDGKDGTLVERGREVATDCEPQ
jgi:hypothetical protein